MTRRVLASLFFLTMTFAPAVGAVAAAPTLPSTAPEACTIERRTTIPKGDEGNLLELSPTPTPVIDETDSAPAYQATIDAVTATVAMSIACRNAGDDLRMLATFSDAWVRGRFDSYDLVYVSSFEARIAMPPTPVADADRRSLVAIEDVVVLPDGTIVATVVTAVGDREERARLRLVIENGAVVIDEAIPLP